MLMKQKLSISLKKLLTNFDGNISLKIKKSIDIYILKLLANI